MAKIIVTIADEEYTVLDIVHIDEPSDQPPLESKNDLAEFVRDLLERHFNVVE